MTGEVEVFLDQTPGETRGIVARDGRYHHLIIHRHDDPPAHRLGAVSVGRVTRVEPGLRGAFVDLGCGEPFGFLKLARDQTMAEGAVLEVVTTAEPRAGKGPALRLVGPASGSPRLLAPGPDVKAILAELAPGVQPVLDSPAIRASQEAEEDALARGVRRPELGLDLAVERTRALIAVDFDHAPAPGRDGRKARVAANRHGLFEAARLIRLKGQGGLVVIDLVGGAQDDETLRRLAREAFGPDAVVGPVSRLGLLQLALPWKRTPVEDTLARSPSLTTAIRGLRLLRARLIEDRSAPLYRLVLPPEPGAIADRLVTELGPRARVRTDAGLGPNDHLIEET